MIFELPFIFFFSLSSLFSLRKLARNIGLVDRPDSRKLHVGSVPLVGGVSLYIVVTYYLLNNTDAFPFSKLYILSISILIGMGVLDDKFDLSVKIRMFIELLVTVFIFYMADIKLHLLGDLLGFGGQGLGIFSLPITVLGVIGAINAYNMVDGIDGLLGGLSLVSFAGIGYLLHGSELSGLSNLCLVIMVSLLPYIFMNLGFLGRERRVFMGDAGSMLIGFTVIWMLLQSTQNGTNSSIRPVTALWIIGIPLIDMVSTMVHRVRQGVSPFKPDREHLHHIFQRIGFSPRQTLVVICCLSGGLTSFGVLGEIKQIPEYLMFYTYIFCFFSYIVIVINLKRIMLYLSDKGILKLDNKM